MNKRVFGMVSGGRMSLDRAAARRRVVWHVQHKAASNGGRPQRPRERRKSRREGEE